MFYSKIIENDFKHGDGCRVTLVLSNKSCDYEYNIAIGNKIISKMKLPECSGLTIAGIGAFNKENQDEILRLLKYSSRIFPQKNIWCFTEQSYESLINSRKFVGGEKNYEMINLIDVLVDRAYDQQLTYDGIVYKPSNNRRILTKQTMMAILEKHINNKEQIIASLSIDRSIAEILKNLCVPVCSNGYHYIKIIIMEIYNKNTQINMQKLYGYAARHFSTNKQSVERCIRSAISASWKRSNYISRIAIFDSYISNLDVAPSNKEFVFSIAEHIRCIRESSM